MKLYRRQLLSLAALSLAGCATRPSMDTFPPVVFVHGNGDTAALWLTTIWRFESNGWPRERLHAIDMPYPLARDDDGKAQPGRTSTAEHMAFLRAEVDKVLQATGAARVVLVGNSRGGNAIRNYIRNGGGDRTVSHAILGGTPNHGIWAVKGFREGNEFSGTGPFLTALNTPRNAAGDEVDAPVKWLTLRSDNNDKYAQPDGQWIGARGTATNVAYDSPALKGATNVVLPRADHRETSFSPAAFEATFRFITGRAPQTTDILPQQQVVLRGKVTGLGVDPLDPASGSFANNLPLRGATLEVFATEPATGARTGAALLRTTIGADGRWGPLTTRPDACLEFVITAAGYATTHIYRSPFPRSSEVVNLRPERLAPADRAAGAVVIFTRPRGYFDPARDRMSLDGKSSLPGVLPGAGVSSSRMVFDSAVVPSVAASFNGESLAARTWPASQGHVSVMELHY